jgi:hypothetical protein
MAAHNLGQTNLAQSEFKLGREMVAEFLNNKLELGNTKSGRLGGVDHEPNFFAGGGTDDYSSQNKR